MSDKYKNGKIYTIRYKNDDSLIYVGSTIQPLFKRWYKHKQDLNKAKCNNTYITWAIAAAIAVLPDERSL